MPTVASECRTDHKKIDDQHRFYTPERLHQIKNDHRNWVETRSAPSRGRYASNPRIPDPHPDADGHRHRRLRRRARSEAPEHVATGGDAGRDHWPPRPDTSVDRGSNASVVTGCGAWEHPGVMDVAVVEDVAVTFWALGADLIEAGSAQCCVRVDASAAGPANFLHRLRPAIVADLDGPPGGKPPPEGRVGCSTARRRRVGCRHERHPPWRTCPPQVTCPVSEANLRAQRSRRRPWRSPGTWAKASLSRSVQPTPDLVSTGLAMNPTPP